ncbi:unnamed protein product, partial [Prorocentrum cordatum]
EAEPLRAALAAAEAAGLPPEETQAVREALPAVERRATARAALAAACRGHHLVGPDLLEAALADAREAGLQPHELAAAERALSEELRLVERRRAALAQLDAALRGGTPADSTELQ